jgi:dihydrofolate synthase/folylpolyglutamate synthase
MSKFFSSSDEIFAWLDPFIYPYPGYTQPAARAERMKLLAEAAGNPEKCAKAVHIAGSKGKGSVTAMVTRILTRAGIRVARYMSPHVVEYRERITLGEEFFDEAVYLAAGEVLREVTMRFCDKASPEYAALAAVSKEYSPEPTFFELLTLYYFLVAKEAAVDALVIETGMGGRLDPTNICDSAVSVITIIELEHTEFLGDTVAKIACEKAGIIKAERPVIVGRQTDDAALKVFRERASQTHSPLFYLPDTALLENTRVHGGGTDFRLSWKDAAFFDAPLDLSIGIPGDVQSENAALAVLAAKTAFPAITAENVTAGLSGFALVARFEKVREEPPAIVDGAHTDMSVKLSAATFVNM